MECQAVRVDMLVAHATLAAMVLRPAIDHLEIEPRWGGMSGHSAVCSCLLSLQQT